MFIYVASAVGLVLLLTVLAMGPPRRFANANEALAGIGRGSSLRTADALLTERHIYHTVFTYVDWYDVPRGYDPSEFHEHVDGYVPDPRPGLLFWKDLQFTMYFDRHDRLILTVVEDDWEGPALC
jgi:hypothetical protein